MELDGRGSPLGPHGPPPSDGDGGGGGGGGGQAGAAPAAAAAPAALETPAYQVELPPCHGAPGPPLCQLPPTEHADPPPAAPPEPPRPPLPPRGKCLLGNWQEERATNPLDRVPSPRRQGSEGFFFRHGHRGLLALHGGAGLARSTTMKDSYRPPRPTGLPVRGQREAMMEWLLYQKHSKEVFEEQVQTAPTPMESQSTTHRDYCQEGFVSVPPAPTKVRGDSLAAERSTPPSSRGSPVAARTHTRPQVNSCATPLCSLTTTDWSSRRPFGWSTPSGCRVSPLSGRVTPPLGNVPPSLLPSRSTWSSPTTKRPTPAFRGIKEAVASSMLHSLCMSACMCAHMCSF